MTKKKDELKERAKRAISRTKPRSVGEDLREQAKEATAREKTPKWAHSQVELAGYLGVRHEVISRWKAKYADIPKRRSDGRLSVEEFRGWMEEHGIGADTEEEMTEKEALEVRRLKAVCDGLEFKNAVERREYLHKDEVRRQVAEAAHVLKRAMRSLKGSLAPAVAGLSVEDAAVAIDKSVEELLGQLHEGVWETSVA